jgi:hypothetical protein
VHPIWRPWRHGLFCLLGGVLLAVHVSHWLLPAANPVQPVAVADGWMSTPNPSHRGYFRHTLQVPFQPEHAWIAIAADDYKLYVNGTEVAGNLHLSTSGNAFQGQLSTPAQSVTAGQVFNMVREPIAHKPAQADWRMMQFYNIRPHLVAGRNTIAVYAQSANSGQLAVAVQGVVSAGPLAVTIPGRASAWRAATESTLRRGKYWFEPAYDDATWGEARPAAALAEGPIFAAGDPDVWQEPFTAPAVTGTHPDQELFFRTTLPRAEPGRPAWLRVRSSWAYEVFVGDSWVGRGRSEPDVVNAFDISQYVHGATRPVTVRLFRYTGPDGSANATAQVPWLAVDGRVASSPINSGAGWSCLESFHPDWRTGGGTWRPAPSQSVTQAPSRMVLQPPGAHTRSWFWELAGLAAVASVLLAAGAWVSARVLTWARAVREGAGLRFSCWLLAPALAGILVQELLRFRFGESDTLLFFLDPDHVWLLGTGPVLLFLSVLLLAGRGASIPLGLRSVAAAVARVPPAVWLGLIVLLGLGLRLYGIDFQPPQADENVSWDAARGILRHGVPRAVSGVFYTRSPLYHYLLAGWLLVCGDSLFSGRCFSLIPGVAVIPALYYLVGAITRRRYLALFAAFVLATDPWQLGIGNFVRFYQQMQFLVVLTTIFFLKGFVWKQGKRYQNYFFVSATAGVLSQEIFATTFPAYLLAFLIWYRPFGWRTDLNVWLGFSTMMGLVLLDVRTYATICLTPHVSVATSSESLFLLHFTDLFGGRTGILPGLATIFFWNEGGNNVYLTVCFLAGLVYWLRYANRAVLVLYGLALLSVFMLTVLVVQIQSRYCFSVYPLFVAAAVISADAMIRRAAGRFARAGPGRPGPARRRWAALVGGVALAGWFFSGEFHKLDLSYQQTRFIDHHAALKYVARNRREGDKVITTHPMAGAVLTEGVDHYAMALVHFDELYLQRHGVVDRWAGGKLIWKVDQFQQVFQQNERVWVVVDEVKLGLMPGPLVTFLHRHCSVEHEFFGGQVLLWDRTAGRSGSFPDRGGAADSY